MPTDSYALKPFPYLEMRNERQLNPLANTCWLCIWMQMNSIICCSFLVSNQSTVENTRNQLLVLKILDTKCVRLKVA